MTVSYHHAPFDRLPKEQIFRWREIPAAVASDCQDRSMAMHGAIKPLDPKMRLIGQVRTAECMVADNSALHAAIEVSEPGDILVANAQGFEDVAIWGGLMTEAAVKKGVAGLIIDGAVRDSEEIIGLGFQCFARAIVPRGPHKGFGGAIDKSIACGGVSVSPGDLVIADADGVTVVPRTTQDRILTAAEEKLAAEEETIAGIRDGSKTLAKIYGVPDITKVGWD